MNLECFLCGSSGPQVRPRMVEWCDPIGSKRWEVIPACVRIPECRGRVEQAGELWPVIETTNEKGAA